MVGIGRIYLMLPVDDIQAKATYKRFLTLGTLYTKF